MATVALKRPKNYIRPAKPLLGNSTPTVSVTASAAFYKGELVKIASGKVARASTPGSAAAATGIFGVATHDVAAASDTALIIPANANLIFEAAVNGASSSAAKYTSKITDVGLRYPFDLSSTNKCWYISKDTAGDTADTSNVVVIGLKDAASTTQGHVYFQFVGQRTVYEGKVTASSHNHG